jgi:CRP-like cAMP-binding protein
MLRAPHSSNLVLASLTATDFATLAPHLQSVDLPQETILYEAGDTVSRIYFPQTGVVSLVVNLGTGEIIEAAMLGRESVVGGMSALGDCLATSSAIVQIAGTASAIDVEHARGLAERSAGFRSVLIRQDQALLAQSHQSVACNAVHSIEGRLARWLLRCHDLTQSDDMPLTQEFLSEMLGVRRTSVTLTASMLQNAGLIRYKRGHIRLLDVEGLRDCACECYETYKLLSARLIDRPS